MSEQRSAIAEFRELEQRRLAGGLTGAELSRYDWLRRVLGNQAAPAPGAGFDMRAAATDLHDSLLPAGLRDQATAPAPPPLAAPEGHFWDDLPGQPAATSPLASSPFPEGGLDASWLSEEEPPAAPPAVKPQAWNPAAPGYDPNAPYDEEAWIAAGYDPNVVYDWSAYGADAAQGAEPQPPGQVVTAPAIPLAPLTTPTSLPPEPEPAEEDLPTLDVLSPEELTPVEAPSPERDAPLALDALPLADALLAPAPAQVAAAVPAPPAPAALAEDDGWPGFEPEAAPLPVAPADQQAASEPSLELLESPEPLADAVEAAPPPAAPLEVVPAVTVAPEVPATASGFDDLLSDDELELLASGGGILEAAPHAPPSIPAEAVPVAAPIASEEPVSLDLLEAPPEEVEVPPLGLDSVQGVLPEPLLDPPTEPAPEVSTDPLHPPLPEAVRANVFVPPPPVFSPPAWAIPSGPVAPSPLPEPAPEPVAEPPPEPVPEPVAARPLALEPLALPPIELSPTELPPIEIEPVELEPLAVEPPRADAPPALLAEPPPVRPEVATPEPSPIPQAGFGAYDELASSGPRFALGAPPVEPLSGAWDAGGEPLLDPAIQPYQPAPPGTPLGEYDEQPIGGGRGIETMLPFDPAAAVAIPLGAVPEGYQAAPPEPEEPSISLELELTGPGLDQSAAVPATVPPVAELSEVSAEWQPEGALDHGFDLVGDGSFGLPELSLGDTPTWPPPAPPSPPPFALGPPGSRAPAPEPAAAPAPPSPPAETLLPAHEVDEVLGFMGSSEASEDALPALEFHPAPAAPLPPAARPPPPPASVFVAPASGLFAASSTPPTRPPAAPPPGPAFTPPPTTVFVPPAAHLFGRPPPAPATTPPPRPPPAIDLDLEADRPRPATAGRPAARPPATTPAPFVQAVPAAPSEQVPPPAAPPVAPPAPTRAAAAAPVAPRLRPTAPAGPPPGLRAPPILAAPPVPAPSTPVVPAPPSTAHLAAGPELESLPPLLPGTRFDGTHRVLVHTVDGEVKRGVLESPVMDGDRLTLLPQGAGAPQVLETAAVKAVFFLLAAGERPPAPEGRKVRVTFRDGRQVLGASPDYQEGQVGFLLIPLEAKTTTARIWVYQASVRQVVIG